MTKRELDEFRKEIMRLLLSNNEDVKKILHKLFGNGDIGMDEVQRQHTRQIKRHDRWLYILTIIILGVCSITGISIKQLLMFGKDITSAIGG